jgi:hypothetical protein
MLDLLMMLSLGVAFAADPCKTPASAVATDAVVLLDVEPTVRAKPTARAKPSPERPPVGLPTGTLSLADLEAVFEQLAEDGATISDFFALLADGKKRTLPGDVVRKALGKYGVDLPFLPVNDLVRIESDGSELKVLLNFGRSSSKKIKLPTTTDTLVRNTDGNDPYNTATTRLETKKGGGHTLVVDKTLTLGISDKGLTSIEGVSVKMFFSFAVKGYSENAPGKLATADGKVKIKVDSDGSPVVVDGHYVPQQFDDWIILKVAGQTIEIGVPALEKSE